MSALKPSPNTAGGRNKLVGLLLLAGLLAVGIVIVLKGRPPASTLPLSPATSHAADPTNRPPATGAFAKLAGRWLRPDGGYVLEFKKVADNGLLEAAYFNPNPIHVARAQATQQGSLIKVMVELQDTGYPGCIYTLLYDGANDTMRGTYFQAAMKETYEVQFERIKD